MLIECSVSFILLFLLVNFLIIYEPNINPPLGSSEGLQNNWTLTVQPFGYLLDIMHIIVHLTLIIQIYNYCRINFIKLSNSNEFKKHVEL